MTRKFLTDQEIDLNQNDFLKTKVYADNLAKIIRNTETDKVFTIGLYGSWGSGKSSIIETAKKEFNQTKTKFITYDAWQYSNDSFRRMFLRCLSSELKYAETDFMKKFYENESMDVDNRFKLSSDRVSIMLFSLLILILILWALPIEAETKTPIYSVFTVLGLLFTLFTGAFHQLKISVTKPYFFAPEQFEQCFKEIAAKSLKTNSITDNLKYLISNDKTVKDLQKLIIVVDNIDRCNSDVAYQLLTDIKTFLGSQKFSIVFIIPVDDKALLKHFFSAKTNDVIHTDKEEFLRKIFNVTLRIKPYNSTDMFAFTKSICSSVQVTFKNETINIIGQEYSRNPRRVIQLMNNLIVELNNYGEIFTNENETIICCILIIREEYPDFYTEVCENSSLLSNYQQRENEALNRFMRIAEIEFKEANNALLNMVLLNSSNHFNAVPLEVVDMINTFDKEGLQKFFSQNINADNNVYDFLCHKIQEAHNNQLRSYLPKYIELVATINDVTPIPKIYLSRVFEKFKFELNSVFNNSESLVLLLKLVEIEDKDFKKYGLRKELIDNLRVNTNSTDLRVKERWLKIVDAILVNITDREMAVSLKEEYDINYNVLRKVDEISEIQFTELVTDKFISRRVDELVSTDITSPSYNEIKKILNRFEDKNLVLAIVFNRFNSSDIPKNFKDQRFEYSKMFNDFIDYANQLKIRYDGISIKQNLDELFKQVDIFHEGRNFTQDPFFKSFEGDKEKEEFFIELLYNYYKFTENLELIEPYLLELNLHNSELIRKKILLFLEQKENINFYFKKIIETSNYNDENLVTLTKYFLSEQDDDFNIVHNKDIKYNIEHLLIWINDDEYREKINDIFEHALEKSKNRNLIFSTFNERLGEKEFDFLNSLNKSIRIKYAPVLEIHEYSNLLNDIFLSFCFDVDDELLNEKIIALIESTTQNNSSFNLLLNTLLSFLQSGDSGLTKLLAKKLCEKFERGNFNLHNNLTRQIKEKIEIIKHRR